MQVLHLSAPDVGPAGGEPHCRGRIRGCPPAAVTLADDAQVRRASVLNTAAYR
jgi:hypothetical protein